MIAKPKIRAAIITVSFLGFSFLLISWFTESPINLFSKNPPSDRGAIAIRDNVSAFEKFGTRLFTYPNLRNAYSECIYLAEYSKHEKHAEFVSGLNDLLSKYESVDIFLLAHANEYYRWVFEIDSSKRKNIRLVYNTGCSGADQKNIWLNLGARSYVAHQSSESISPVFYFYFLRRWCNGEQLTRAVDQSNSLMIDKLVRLHIKLDPAVLSGSKASLFGAADLIVNEK